MRKSLRRDILLLCSPTTPSLQTSVLPFGLQDSSGAILHKISPVSSYCFL